MFIPAQTPDLQLPLTQLLETKPVVPVTAVPGIPEDAQHLDSRVALQWAQPVLPGEKGQAARNALAIPLAVQLINPLAIKGFEPQCGGDQVSSQFSTQSCAFTKHSD